MERIPIVSSNLVSVGYDEGSSTLEIEFANGIYQYSSVSEDVYEGLMNASSPGRYFNMNIKDSYPCTQVG